MKLKGCVLLLMIANLYQTSLSMEAEASRSKPQQPEQAQEKKSWFKDKWEAAKNKASEWSDRATAQFHEKKGDYLSWRGKHDKAAESYKKAYETGLKLDPKKTEDYHKKQASRATKAADSFKEQHTTTSEENKNNIARNVAYMRFKAGQHYDSAIAYSMAAESYKKASTVYQKIGDTKKANDSSTAALNSDTNSRKMYSVAFEPERPDQGEWQGYL